MNIYEDEQEDRDRSVLAFLRQNRRLVLMAVAVMITYGLMSLASRQFDQAVANEDAAKAATHPSANPWSKDS